MKTFVQLHQKLLLVCSLVRGKDIVEGICGDHSYIPKENKAVGYCYSRKVDGNGVYHIRVCWSNLCNWCSGFNNRSSNLPQAIEDLIKALEFESQQTFYTREHYRLLFCKRSTKH
ncbi:hypothetical protein P8452_56854 [Trifolium repens]|nr:hypothetical protein P8452_56854 [Trifolium repens]